MSQFLLILAKGGAMQADPVFFLVGAVVVILAKICEHRRK